MKKIVILSTVLLTFTPKAALAQSDAEVVHTLLKEIEAKKLPEALVQLQSLEIRSPHYPVAFSETQKALYKNAQWDLFFAYAQYYRKNLMPLFFDPNLVTLEALALAKHCQFKPALEISEGISGVLTLLKKEKDQKFLSQPQLNRASVTADEALALIQVQAAIPGNVDTKEKDRKVSAFSRNLLWKIRNEESRSTIIKQTIRTPRRLRVYVQNKCASTKGAAL